jgi:hypothetical protein
MHDDGKLDTIIDDRNLRDLTVLQQRFTPSTTSVPEVHRLAARRHRL